MKYRNPKTGEIWDSETNQITAPESTRTRMTPAEYMALNASLEPDPGYSPTSGMSTADKALAGLGKSFYDTARGIGQLAGVVDSDAVAQSRALDAPLMGTGAGLLGNIAGHTLQTFAPGGALKGAAMMAPGRAGQALGAAGSAMLAPQTAKQAATLGAGYAALQPTVQGESRAMNAAMGGAFGAGGQKAGQYIGQGFTKASPYMRQVASKAKKLGFKTTPGQDTGNAAMRQIEASMASNPITANKMAAIKESNQTAMNRVASKAIGENADEITEHVLGSANKRIKSVFKGLMRDKNVPLDDDALEALIKIEEGYVKLPTGRGDATFRNTVDYLMEEMDNGMLSGDKFLTVRNELSKVVRNAWKGENSNPELAKAVGDIIDVMDDSARKVLPKKSWDAYTKARQEWANLTKVETSLNGQNASGPKLATKLKRKDKTGYLRGGGRSDPATQDLYDAVRFADTHRNIVGDSGTATRFSMPMLFSQMGGGATGGGLLSYLTGNDPWLGAAVGAAGMPLAMRAGQAGYLSRPMQAALTQPGLLGAGANPSLVRALQSGMTHLPIGMSALPQ